MAPVTCSDFFTTRVRAKRKLRQNKQLLSRQVLIAAVPQRTGKNWKDLNWKKQPEISKDMPNPALCSCQPPNLLCHGPVRRPAASVGPAASPWENDSYDSLKVVSPSKWKTRRHFWRNPRLALTWVHPQGNMRIPTCPSFPAHWPLRILHVCTRSWWKGAMHLGPTNEVNYIEHS